MAHEIAPGANALLNSGLGSSYNISFNLSSIFTYPSRFLARMIQKGDTSAGTSFEIDPTTTWVDQSTMSGVAAATATATAKSVAAAPALFPGPWGFFSSGYVWGLLIMGVLMHRIDNIFVPTTFTFRLYPQTNQRRNRNSILNRFFPININRTSTRLAIHLPTIYFMLRILILWGILILQTSDLFPWTQSAGEAESTSANFSLSNIAYRLGTWAASWQMEDVCWHTFCAICAAFCVEGFVKSLDGNGHGFFAFAEHSMQTSTSPFNLVGYAFLLHIYSSPLTHAYKPHKDSEKSELLPSRPESDALIILSIPLLQLTIFHILSVRKRWSRHRLLPTALASALSLTHFHMALFRFMMNVSSSPSTSSPANTSSSYPITSSLLRGYTYTPRHAPHGYPMLNYIPNMFETLLLCTIFLTVFLNVITQFLLTGRVNKPLLGLGISSSTSNESWTEMIPWDEDFGVVLLRVGTASLEATGLRGWGNEVGGVVASSRSRRDDTSRKYGSIRLTRTGVLGVSPGIVTNGKTRTSANGKGKTKTKMLKGWNNEVRDVDLGTDPSNSSGGRRGQWGMNGVFTLNAQWFAELKRFVQISWGVTLGAIKVGWEVLRGRRKLFQGSYRRGVPDQEDDGQDNNKDDEYEDRRKEAEEEELYRRFLRGEHVTDDEDDEFDSSETQGEEDEIDEDDDDVDVQELEAVRLYSDLANRESTPGASATSTMLAHMSYTGASPLTRRRYGSLSQNQNQTLLLEDSSDGDDLDVFNIRGSGSGSATGGSEIDDARRNCVICTTDARVIICWPCRCLAMCDSCRESLAARSSASKHRCPCCRRGVEGYSRIYIP